MVPDFEHDAAAISEYEDAIKREQRRALEAAESELRGTYARRRTALTSEIKSAAEVFEDHRKRSAAAVHAYGKRYPHRVHGSQLERPGFWEFLFSFGGALRFYKNAVRSIEAMLEAQSVYRRHLRAEQDLEEWLARALARAATEVRETVQTQAWLDTFHAQPDIEPLWMRVQSIRAEREEYQRRLEAGDVPPDEQRARFMAENKLTPLRAPAEHVVIESILRFGDLYSWIFIDGAGAKYFLPYDPRLQNLVEWAFDTYLMVDRMEVKFTRLEDGRRVSALDQYIGRLGEEDGRIEWRTRNSSIRSQQESAREAPVDDDDDKRLLDLLAAIVAAVV